MQTLVLTDASRIIAGIVLLTVVTVELGGRAMLRIVTGQMPMSGPQTTFARAMHAHAGVLVILSLVCLVLADAAGLTGLFGWLGRIGVPLAAILLPAGFALTTFIGKGEPKRFLWLILAGGVSLAIGVVSIGIGLLVA